MTTDRVEDPTPFMTDVVSVRIDGATVYAEGVVTERTVDLLLGAVGFLTRTAPQVLLDLTSVSTVDVEAVRALFTARYDALAAGTTLELVIPSHLRRRLAVCRPLPVETRLRSTRESPDSRRRNPA